MNQPFAGRVILVVGSSGLLGESLCRFFLDHNAQVVGCSRSQSAITHSGFSHHVCNIADEQAVVKMFSLLERTQRSPDTVILNAASSATSMVAMLSAAQIDMVAGTNLKGASLVLREALKQMTRNRFGRVIALSSIRVSIPARGTAIYAMTKAGLEQIIKVLPFEVGNLDITFNAIEVSVLESGMATNLSAPERKKLIESLVIKRFCRPADVCNAVEFFARPESSYVTGQILKLGFV